MKRYIDIDNKLINFIEVNKPRFQIETNSESLQIIRLLQYRDGRYMWEPSFNKRYPNTLMGIPIKKTDCKGLKLILICYFDNKELYRKEFNLKEI